VLVDLASGRRPLTHATLDDLPPSKAVEHLRSVLVATAVLPARDEQLARLQRWISQTLTERTDPRDRELLRRYAVWHELRRIRQRNRGTETTYGQFDMVRQRLRGAIRLLDWLHTRGIDSTLHKARHWAGKNILRAADGNVRVAQEFLGHASLNSTMLYTFVSGDQVRAAAERLPPAA
jgi:integrase